MEQRGNRVDRQVERLLGIYRADGGLLGELRYVTGTMLGAAHCSLCHITHGHVRRKREWDAFVASLPVPFDLAHRNELEDGTRAFAAQAACVIALVDGAWELVLGDDDLTALDGSVPSLAEALATVLAEARWSYAT